MQCRVIERVGSGGRRRPTAYSHRARTVHRPVPARMCICVHPLLLRTRGQPHGDFLSPANADSICPCEVGKDDERRSPNYPRPEPIEVPIIALDIVRSRHRASPIRMGHRGILGKACSAPSSDCLQPCGDRRNTWTVVSKTKGCTPDSEPRDLPSVSGTQKPAIPLSPSGSLSPLSLRQKGCETCEHSRSVSVVVPVINDHAICILRRSVTTYQNSVSTALFRFGALVSPIWERRFCYRPA